MTASQFHLKVKTKLKRCKFKMSVAKHQGGIQFFSDELSEVSRNRQLTVQFLRADFGTVSEVSGKNLR